MSIDNVGPIQALPGNSVLRSGSSLSKHVTNAPFVPNATQPQAESAKESSVLRDFFVKETTTSEPTSSSEKNTRGYKDYNDSVGCQDCSD